VERVELKRAGARAVAAVVGGFAVQRLDFPAGHRIPWYEPDDGYLVVVLQGALCKRFSTAAWTLSRDSFATLPAGSAHGTEFGVEPTRVLTIRSCTEDSRPLFARFLRSRRHMRATAASALGRRLAIELQAPDASWGLAAEGLVLHLLAMGEREDAPRRRPEADWLSTVVEQLHEESPRSPSLRELAAAAGVHPGHLARAFRAAYGVTVCEYSRTLRLEWAAQRLADDAPLAQVALDAGFADQSHFTRSFRAYAGMTPGRYRELLRR
jgi:AraC family transcriptional regulator